MLLIETICLTSYSSLITASPLNTLLCSINRCCLHFNIRCFRAIESSGWKSERVKKGSQSMFRSIPWGSVQFRLLYSGSGNCIVYLRSSFSSSRCFHSIWKQWNYCLQCKNGCFINVDQYSVQHVRPPTVILVMFTWYRTYNTKKDSSMFSKATDSSMYSNGSIQTGNSIKFIDYSNECIDRIDYRYLPYRIRMLVVMFYPKMPQ